ncbi:unnamed protein product [Cylindrotheca closterium]|uniref:Uncharacterized protein n=1 Tax=Cylindrotheca closterium TaxID=2856 RepID=A0AAD2JGL8_9STRA|nr:unnamed protein product [Cylindrotheca closterium]
MVSMLEGCSEGCGIAAALIAVFTWGTFGVPLKCNVNVEVNFFVMQSYKTLVCFCTSWLVIFLGEPIRWTPWGIVSGLFWVPGASCGIYAIRNAGVAVAVGTWSSIQVITSCIFGILIFQESVKDTSQTIMAIMTLMVGLVGMSRYSDSSVVAAATKEETTVPEYAPVLSTDSEEGVGVPSYSPAPRKIKRTISDGITEQRKVIPFELELQDDISQPLIDTSMDHQYADNYDDAKDGKEKMVRIFNGRIVLTQRQMGLLAAIVNGAWGGLNLIPLHYAQRDSGMSGASYLISYATGSLIVCVSIWIGMFLYHFMNNQQNVQEALDQLPAFHVRELGIPGVMAGLLYSIGNFCSILAVAYLGQGVGFSFCQGQLLVSGLWGVFYFGEIQGRETIIKWFGSAVVTVTGIIWLSAMHENAPAH